jgi:hypothetical protein
MLKHLKLFTAPCVTTVTTKSGVATIIQLFAALGFHCIMYSSTHRGGKETLIYPKAACNISATAHPRRIDVSKVV